MSLSRYLRRTWTFARLMARGDFAFIQNRMRFLLFASLSRWVPAALRFGGDRYRGVRLGKRRPFVSIVVPNFNHAPYLKQRLDSVYGQTYQNFEVILLDDASTDGSAAILSEYQRRFPERTRLIRNELNGGSGYRQWAKGIGLAKGDLIWIAESDDHCDLDFLETMVQEFADEAVTLAYCRSTIVDANGQRRWTSEEYLSDLSVTRWSRSFTSPAYGEVKAYFSTKNLICNASSAVFRRPVAGGLVDDEEWRKLKICGDWLLYLDVARGGVIAYVHDVTNYYRVHDTNVSVASFAREYYYRELEFVGRYLRSAYGLTIEELAPLQAKAELDFRTHADGRFVFADEFSLARVGGRSVKPRVALCAYALATGGGEIFPIQLANALKRRGYAVTFVDFALGERNEHVRAMLDADVPLVTLPGLPAFRGVCLDFGLQVLHSHNADVDLVVNEVTRDLKAKHVVTLHGMYESLEIADLQTRLPALIEGVDHWVYIADKNLVPFEGRLPASKFTKISNAVPDLTAEAHDRASLGLTGDAFLVCLASRAIPEKGWFQAVDSVRLVRERTGRDVHLLLVGDGPARDELAAAAPPFVHLLGFRRDVARLFATSDLGLLPSFFSGESQPLVVMECLKAGRPVLATDVGAIRDMLQAQDDELAGDLVGLVDGRLSAGDLADKLERFVADPDFLRRKQEAARVAARKFSMERMVSLYANVYEGSAPV